jgi:hypothetical protein
MDKPRLSPQQAGLLHELISRRAPQLEHVADILVSGDTITHRQADELEDALAAVMLDEEVQPDGELTQRGRDIEDVISLAWQLSEGFHASEGERQH